MREEINKELLDKINESPDIREEKIKEIKEKINSGTYNISTSDLAEKILNKS